MECIAWAPLIPCTVRDVNRCEKRGRELPDEQLMLKVSCVMLGWQGKSKFWFLVTGSFSPCVLCPLLSLLLCVLQMSAWEVQNSWHVPLATVDSILISSPGFCSVCEMQPYCWRAESWIPSLTSFLSCSDKRDSALCASAFFRSRKIPPHAANEQRAPFTQTECIQKTQPSKSRSSTATLTN